ncbi:MAG: hypothetical protein ACI976_002835, partial [Aureispira sp.]
SVNFCWHKNTKKAAYLRLYPKLVLGETEILAFHFTKAKTWK